MRESEVRGMPAGVRPKIELETVLELDHVPRRPHAADEVVFVVTAQDLTKPGHVHQLAVAWERGCSWRSLRGFNRLIVTLENRQAPSRLDARHRTLAGRRSRFSVLRGRRDRRGLWPPFLSKRVVDTSDGRTAHRRRCAKWRESHAAKDQKPRTATDHSGVGHETPAYNRGRRLVVRHPVRKGKERRTIANDDGLRTVTNGHERSRTATDGHGRPRTATNGADD